jgi:hypothetical protein
MKDRSGNRKVRVPGDLFHEALALRSRGDVSDYRNRLSSAQENVEDGHDDTDWLKNLQRTRIAVQSTLQVKQSVKTVTVDIAPIPKLGASQDVDTSPLRNWLISVWPGKRYRRLLCSLVKEQAAERQIERGLEKVWRSGRAQRSHRPQRRRLRSGCNGFDVSSPAG